MPEGPTATEEPDQMLSLSDCCAGSASPELHRESRSSSSTNTCATIVTRIAGAARARMRVYDKARSTSEAAQPVRTISASPCICMAPGTFEGEKAQCLVFACSGMLMHQQG